jgi:hypothetical protein
MVWIPGGTYRMGSDRHYPEEAPVHRVSLNGFWIDRTPVTNRLFKEFVRATGHRTFAEIPPDPKNYPGALPHMLYAERRAAMYGIPASLPAPPMSAVLFESDGSSIAVSVDGSSRTLGKCPPADISTLVNEALLNALATYYSKWEGLQPRWR